MQNVSTDDQWQFNTLDALLCDSHQTRCRPHKFIVDVKQESSIAMIECIFNYNYIIGRIAAIGTSFNIFSPCKFFQQRNCMSLISTVVYVFCIVSCCFSTSNLRNATTCSVTNVIVLWLFHQPCLRL